ncbi:amidohydrolase family protein [Henriciella aquimarina]|uniref:amidohydrolase family protein n=1 Tax=Henriciella aquimarina TaxID=545261 RepID=UPI0009FD36D4|nr:amidohydrolase family protein [Henriciella aquimarina]
MRGLNAVGLILGLVLSFTPAVAQEGSYDLVILNGRAIDPETGLDAVRNIGVEDGRIVAVTEDALEGAQVIDAEGLVVAPGFIDLHAHGMSIPAGRMQAFDGVTTALELEAGVLPVAGFYEKAAEEGRAINYGASVSWAYARIAEFTDTAPSTDMEWFADFMGEPSWQYDLASQTQRAAIMNMVQQGLDEGALGIGVLLGYAPESGRREYYELHQLAAENDVPTFTHARFLSNVEPDSSFEGFEEMVAVSAATGAHMHVCHLNSIAQRDIPTIRQMIEGAQARGVPITVEAYPYGAGATSIGAAMFQGEDWQARMGGIEKSDFTRDGDPLSDEEFDRLQAEAPGTDIVVHFIHPDTNEADAEILAQSVLYPGGAIASDGGDWALDGERITGNVWPLPEDAESHPRSAGTFSKFLRVYVREKEALSLVDALAKTSLIPAQILGESVPQMKRKGRLQEGADADIVVFDPETVSDRATFARPAQTSEGFSFVIVGGTPLISKGVLDTGVMPGRPVRRAH